MALTRLEVRIPDPGVTHHYLLGHDHIAFVYVNYEECARNPLKDCDGMGSIQSFCRRHIGFCHPSEIKDDDDRVFLSYFEHGKCLWGVQGTISRLPDFRWDGVLRAGVWYPDKCLKEQADKEGLEGEARREKMKQWAAEACELYTKYCNGHVYFARVTTYKVRRTDSGTCFNQENDYRYDEALVEESCGDFYEQSHIVEFVQDNLKFAIERLDIQLSVKVKA